MCAGTSCCLSVPRLKAWRKSLFKAASVLHVCQQCRNTCARQEEFFNIQRPSAARRRTSPKTTALRGAPCPHSIYPPKHARKSLRSKCERVAAPFGRSQPPGPSSSARARALFRRHTMDLLPELLHQSMILPRRIRPGSRQESHRRHAPGARVASTLLAGSFDHAQPQGDEAPLTFCPLAP